LQDEESGIENPYRERGAPTVIDSIFRGELLETRSCIYCQSASAFHGYFWELSLSLPSKEDLSKSIKSQPMKVATQLLSASESNLGKIDAKSGDSHFLISEFNDLVADKTSDPMEVGEFLQSYTYSKFLTTGNGYVLYHTHSGGTRTFYQGGWTIRRRLVNI